MGLMVSRNKSGIGTGHGSAPLTLKTEHGAMDFLGTTTLSRETDDEATALDALRLALGATKTAARHLMRRYPDHAALGRSIIDSASDGESDIVGTLAALDERMPRHPDRGGAT
jgi:hypothetical protein